MDFSKPHPKALMKTRILLSTILFAGASTFRAGAGTLFYVPIPAQGSDAQSGVDPAKDYTNAIAAGTTKEAGRTVNGVKLAPLTAAENPCTANGVTLTAATGTLANGGGKAESIQADGAMGGLLTGMIFNDGAKDNSEQYAVLDPATLTAGKTYDLRVYVCNASGENRQVNLTFAGDGKPAVSTDFFNEDDATTSAGGFIEPNQVYYINYRFTWDGISTPGFTATQRFGSTPFCLFALTNQAVGADAEAQPAGAVVQVQPEPIAARPKSGGAKSRTSDFEDDIGVSSDVFYHSDSLRRHGRWVTVGSYGRCWQPQNVPPDWQPYTRGRWVHSDDDGWVWDSDEDFGWATYHYGRWFREEDSGWCWVPGKVWAPAWVSWRHGHSYVGWAPLPPLALIAAGVGISSWADHRWGIGPRAYNFVNARDLGAPSMAKVLIPQQQNAAIMSNTNNVTNIVGGRHGIFNGGPSFQAVNNALIRTGAQPVPTVRVSRHAGIRPITPDGKFSQLSAGVLSVIAPPVSRNKKSAPLPPVAVTITAPKFDKGWNGIADPRHATALQAKIANETPGTAAKTAPARPPGMIAFPPAVAGTAGANVIKPFRGGKPSDPSAGIKPGTPVQPAVSGTAAVAKPPKPGPPINPPPVAPTQPAKPATPIARGEKNRATKAAPPTAPVLPVQPADSASTVPLQPGKMNVPADAPPGKPGKPAKPTTLPPPVLAPRAVQPSTPPAPTTDPARPKKHTPPPVPPTVPANTAKPNTAAPPASVPAARTPKPAVPIPPPVVRQTPRPAPPVVIPPRPAAPVAPPAVTPHKPVPPVSAPVKPVAPAVPAPAPGRGPGKPTPTPEPKR